MPCVHLKQLYKHCQENEIKIGGLDVVRLVCKKCNVKDVCPSVLTDEFDSEVVDTNSPSENESVTE